MTILSSMEKKDVLEEVKAEVERRGLTIVDEDIKKPWGAYFVISESQIEHFIKQYFSDVEFTEAQMMLKMRPKILVVAPGARLSWQYHHRRSELWKVVNGPVGVAQNSIDTEVEPKVYNSHDVVTLEQGTRHRLVGLENWGVVAEIWRHTDPKNPSNEEDIVRVQDDFGR